MTSISQKEAAKRFAEYWKGKGYEKGQSQPFWLSLLREVYGIAEPEKFITFEDQVHLDNTSFIDGFIHSTHVMIEQKGLGKDLNKQIKQSDGSYLTPYQQAKRYSIELPYSERPRWIVTCNFESFLIYDMERPGVEPQLIYLKDLPEEYWRLEFLVDDEKRRIQKEQDISEDAGKIIKLLYDALSECYGDMSNTVNQKSLNKLIVRLVFCLYAEDSEMFSHGQFEDYVSHFDADDLSDALYNLFVVLDTPEEQRRRGLKAILAAFPYTNGGLFHDKPDADDTEIPPLSEEVKRILVEEAASFNWSAISPTIFGGIFESTLNPDTRRKGGMHYTSIDNIHKVIDPLFLDELKAELDSDLNIKVNTKRKESLLAFQDKIAGLKFLDPACGSGNFLTETYLSLRRLENRVIKALYGEGMLGLRDDLIKVSIQQFYGIEINDFAVSVATTALWISESQMLRETESIIAQSLPALPLKTYTNIHEGNALRMDWNEVINCKSLNYCLGNPPFVGLSLRNEEQQEDMNRIFPGNPRAGRLDYVTAWYKKAAGYYADTKTECAFVSTNSIVQGEQVPILWQDLISNHHVSINFAYRSFLWNSEAAEKAHVHCVIIGFAGHDVNDKKVYDGSSVVKARNINGYLLNADNIYIQLKKDATDGRPKIIQGNKPWDGGFLVMKKEERDAFLSKSPQLSDIVHPFIGSYELINGKERYCLWLVGVEPSRYRNDSEVMRRIAGVADTRRKTKTVAVQALADTPTLFAQIRQPSTSYLAIPEVSGESRKYIPLGYLTSDVIASNKLFLIPEASLFLFGLLNSNVHNAWMRIVAGRLGMSYSYSPAVYNNFPWPTPTDAQKAKIEETAKAILDARNLYPDSSLADLYDELTMPVELRKAHRANDAAVMEAYGFRKDMTEPEIVAELFKLYQTLVEKQ